MDSRKAAKSLPYLADTLHSLLGLKHHLTPNWIKSVQDILKTLPSQASTCTRSSPTDAFDTSNQHFAAASISAIRDQLTALTCKIKQLNIQRRHLLNDFLDLKGNIRVFCRIRPMPMAEDPGFPRPVVVAPDSYNVVLRLTDNKRKSYSFDEVFQPGSSQDEVFLEVEPIIKSILDGYNACILAYGQTGSGKTFTMEGTPYAPGIVPRAIEALFRQAADSNRTFIIKFSMLEIYMGSLRDLLVLKPVRATDAMPPCLSIQADPSGGVEIDNLVAIQVSDFNQAQKLYKLGCRFRSTASTDANITSSRSHCMIRISVTCFDAPERSRETNKIWLVDLGGSERVLKTKARGKRLDEGKAINLSLLALGDVISALHSKKCHVPYRNSKLTQVLKDSLGDDSKALMLVHVSPKEEDLCETICSLNFATRAKNINLGNEDIIEVREQKEVAMVNLQQNMKQIEDEQLRVRSEIKEVNKKLESLTGITFSLEENEAASVGEASPTNNRIGEMTAVTMSKLPTFMKPTICSQKRSGASYQTSKGKEPILAKRRLQSCCAESVTFPVKENSEFNLKCSISRSSCLAGLSINDNYDNSTEYSQDTPEINYSVVDLQDQEIAQRTSINQKVEFTHAQKNRYIQTNKSKDIKFSKVKNWLHLQYSDSTTSCNTHRNKRIIAIPAPEKKHMCNGLSKTENFRDEKLWSYKCRINNIVNCNNKGKCVAVKEVGYKAALEKDLTTSISSMSETQDSVKTSLREEISRMPGAGSADTSLMEDNEGSTSSLHDVFCGGIGECKDDYGNTLVSTKQAFESESQCPDGFLLKSGCLESSLSELDQSINYSKEDSTMSVSILEFESCCQQVQTEIEKEFGEGQEFGISLHTLAVETKSDLLRLRSKKSNNTNQKYLAKPYGETQTKGICNFLKQKIAILSASTLLGLGFYNLGFQHDFFYGLML